MLGNLNWNIVIEICLIAGIVYLASNNYDGWGWLVFILFVRNHD